MFQFCFFFLGGHEGWVEIALGRGGVREVVCVAVGVGQACVSHWRKAVASTVASHMFDPTG